MSQIGLPKLIHFQSVIYRIIVVIGTFSCDDSGGLESGENASLRFNVDINESTKFSFNIDYDPTKESDLTYDTLVSSILESGEDANVKPGDIVKINLTTDYPSGTTFTYDNITIKLLASKIYF